MYAARVVLVRRHRATIFSLAGDVGGLLWYIASKRSISENACAIIQHCSLLVGLFILMRIAAVLYKKVPLWFLK